MPRALLRNLGYPKLALCLLMLWVVGCASPKGVKTDPLMRSLSSLHKLVRKTMVGAIKKRSENTRVYHSKYHAVGMDINAGTAKKKERGQLIVSIMGDRRPYKVTFLYRIEKKMGGEFKFDRYDKSLALQYKERFDENLASRPEDRDVIDDFRPY